MKRWGRFCSFHSGPEGRFRWPDSPLYPAISYSIVDIGTLSCTVTGADSSAKRPTAFGEGTAFSFIARTE